MLIDPRLEDYYAALFSFYGVQVLVHGNRDYPEISARGILLSPLKEAFLQVRHYLVSVSTSIHSLHAQFYLYHQVSIAPTLIFTFISKYPVSTLSFVCISKYPQPQTSFVFVSASIMYLHTQLSVSASIHRPNRHLYLYQQVSRVSTSKYFCISKYPQIQPSFVTVSVSIHSPNTHCVCISQYPQPQTSLCWYQQVSAASTYSTADVRALRKDQRQCLFEDEQVLKIANKNSSGYSYSNCLVQCRLEHMDELCQCSPYFYPTGGSLFVNLRGHIITRYSCETGHYRRFKAFVTSRLV